MIKLTLVILTLLDYTKKIFCYCSLLYIFVSCSHSTILNLYILHFCKIIESWESSEIDITQYGDRLVISSRSYIDEHFGLRNPYNRTNYR